MGSLLQQQKQTEFRKRVVSFGAASTGILFAFFGHPILGLSLFGVGSYLVWDWFKFRAKRGMRF